MMRQRLNLTLRVDNGYRMLIHGGYNVGKTHLVGDFLATMAQRGSTHFINVKGEDGYLTLGSFDLGKTHAETIESADDLKAAVDELAKKPVLALGIDSLRPLNRLVQAKTLGTTDRMAQKTEWGDVHFLMEQLVMSLQRAAKYVVATCPSDRSSELLSGNTFITPDLPGREAAGSAGWFDFVGYLRLEMIGSNAKRTLSFKPSGVCITRARGLPRPVGDVVLPDGPGGWKLVEHSIQLASTPTLTNGDAK
jgi:hypothetical protein